MNEKMRQTDDLLQLDIMGLHNEYVRGTISPVEVLDYLYDRIDKIDNLNAFITLSQKQAYKQAKQAEREYMNNEKTSILLGIPIGLKDLIYTNGIRTTCGSGVFKNFIPNKDAFVVSVLKKMGVVITGKQNTHELAYGTTGDDSYFGVMRNPYNEARIAGGSSGGSASSITAGLCWGSIGTDTSGSIRIPAALCGAVGMKPTFGRIDNSGIYPLSPSMDHVGPITKKVKDNAILYDALCETLDSSQSIVNNLRISGLKGKKIGVFKPKTKYKTDNEIKKSYQKTIGYLKLLGAKVIQIDIDIPELDDLMDISNSIDRSEAYLVNRKIIHETSNLLGEETRKRILQGADYKAYEYIIAQDLKLNLTEKFKEIFNNIDAILTPTTPVLSQKIGVETVEVNGVKFNLRSILMRNTFISNFIGIPSITIPSGFSKKGLPIGMQFLGGWNCEKKLYKISFELENYLKNLL